MKKFGKILLVMAVCMVAVLAMMTVASAATIASVEPSVDATGDRAISVTVEYGNPEAAQQSTILVVKQGTSIATLKDTDIKYIDQEPVSDTAVTYTFKLLEADRTGAYDVYVGGTNVDAPESASFSFDTRKIIGTITVLGDATKATAIAGTTTGTVKADGTYAIEVGQGTYDVVLGKAGYLYKTYEDVVVGTADVDLGTIELIGGDFNADKEVSLTDLESLLKLFAEKSVTVDLDDDGEVTLVELEAVLTNFAATEANAYPVVTE